MFLVFVFYLETVFLWLASLREVPPASVSRGLGLKERPVLPLLASSDFFRGWWLGGFVRG